MDPKIPHDEIEAAADHLRDGGVVAFPTETVYGLGANALDPTAVARIFEIKNRPRFDPLIVHAGSVEAARALVLIGNWNSLAEKLAEAFWPGPLTLVMPKHSDVPDLVTSGLPTVALRVPDHEIALALLTALGFPIAAPSANKFGCVSPTTANHVRDSLGEDVDFILDGGPCRAGVESTIIALSQGTEEAPVVLRTGAIPLEDIEQCTGMKLRRASNREAYLAPEAPGMLESHYATQTPLVFLTNSMGAGEASEALNLSPNARTGVICFDDPNMISIPGEASEVEVLSPHGDLREAAANLFAAMRRLDALNLDVILTHEFPDHGLGVAINDRLRRAAHRRRPESSA